MKAARFHGIRDLRWEDVDDPACRPGAVKVRPAFNGICGTDVHEFFDGPIWTPSSPIRSLASTCRSSSGTSSPAPS